MALSLVLTVFTFETAVHSVHHLADPHSGVDCPLLSGSQNLAWARPTCGSITPVHPETEVVES